jgi:hypothetical protein
MNYFLKDSTHRYLNLAFPIFIYAFVNITQLSFWGTKPHGDFWLTYQNWAYPFPYLMMLAIGFAGLSFQKIDRQCHVNRAGARCAAETNVYRLMGLYKYAMCLVATAVTYRFAIVHFYGVGFFDFTPERSWFESRYAVGTVRVAQRDFFTSDQMPMYTALYSFLVVYVVGGSLGYYYLKTLADDARRAVYRGSVARTAH